MGIHKGTKLKSPEHRVNWKKSPELLKFVRNQWEAGVTFTEISIALASEFGLNVSRGRICGLITRLKWGKEGFKRGVGDEIVSIGNGYMPNQKRDLRPHWIDGVGTVLNAREVAHEKGIGYPTFYTEVLATVQKKVDWRVARANFIGLKRLNMKGLKADALPTIYLTAAAIQMHFEFVKVIARYTKVILDNAGDPAKCVLVVRPVATEEEPASVPGDGAAESVPEEPEIIPPEAAKEEKADPGTWLTYNGIPIHDRGGDMLNLTDMWRANGSDLSKTPAIWLRSAEARSYTAFLADIMRISHDLLFDSSVGRNGETWAYWQLALTYATYLSHEFRKATNDLVWEHMGGSAGWLQGGQGKAVTPSDQQMMALARIVVESLTKTPVTVRGEDLANLRGAAQSTVAKQIQGLIEGALQGFADESHHRDTMLWKQNKAIADRVDEAINELGEIRKFAMDMVQASEADTKRYGGGPTADIFGGPGERFKVAKAARAKYEQDMIDRAARNKVARQIHPKDGG